MLDTSVRLLHVVAVVLYLGGGILLHVSVRAALRFIPPGQASIVAARVGRDFTYLCWISLALWGVTGYWMMFRYGLGEVSAPLTLFVAPATLRTSRGAALLVMVLAWYLIVISAAIITFALRPRVGLRVTAGASSEESAKAVATISGAARWIDVLALANLFLSILGVVAAFFL